MCDTCAHAHVCHKHAHTQAWLIFMPGEGAKVIIFWLSKLKLGEIDLSELYTELADGDVGIQT